MGVSNKVAWRNIWRNPRRSLLTTSAVVFACVLLIFMVSLQAGSYDAIINTAVRLQAGHIQVQAEGYNDKPEIRKVVRQPRAVAELIDKNPRIEAIAFRANAFSLVSSTMQRAEYLTEKDGNATVVGNLLAKNLSVDVGDELVILGQGYDGSVAANALTVKGVFRTGQPDFDRSALQIPLATFQSTYDMDDAVHKIVVMGKDLEEVGSLAESIRAELGRRRTSQNLAVLTWNELMPGLEQAIQVDMMSAWIFYGILIVVVAFSIMNTFVMAVFERTHEFGVLIAIGMKRIRLIGMVLLESAYLTIWGVILGILVGVAVTYYFQIHGIDISGTEDLFAQYGLPSVLRPKLTVGSVLSGPLIIFAVTLLTAAFPTFRILKLKLVRAMRD
ncbi:MAG: ABC transporter permease [Deltaproteobacteria bacterium]|nr:ABC transporter permease [Deltaproteobacteria bacterium]